MLDNRLTLSFHTLFGYLSYFKHFLFAVLTNDTVLRLNPPVFQQNLKNEPFHKKK